MSRKSADYPWTIRRRFMFAVSAFCAGVIAYVIYKAIDTKPADTAVTMGFLVLFGIVGSYVFGATWQDVSSMKYSKLDSTPPEGETK